MLVWLCPQAWALVVAVSVLTALTVLPGQPWADRSGPSEEVTVTAAWSTVRALPNTKAKATGLVYGNDRLPVIERRGAWLRVRLASRGSGWLEESDVAGTDAPPPAPELSGSRSDALSDGGTPGDSSRRSRTSARASTLAAAMTDSPDGTGLHLAPMLLREARGLQASGLGREARDAFLEVLLLYPEAPEFYHAAHYLDVYHHTAALPRVAPGSVTPRRLRSAQEALLPLLLAEGRALLAEQQPLDAAGIFQTVLLHGPPASPYMTEARDGLRQALGALPTQPGPLPVEEAVEMARDLKTLYLQSPEAQAQVGTGLRSIGLPQTGVRQTAMQRTASQQRVWDTPR